MIKEKIADVINQLEGSVGLYFEDLDTGETITINESMSFPAASIIKIPLVSLVLKQASQGQLDLHAQITMADDNRVGGAGVITLLDKCFRPTVRDLALLAIVLSDNAATNQLIDLVGGVDAVKAHCSELGMLGTELQRKLMDYDAKEAGLDNITTPGDMGLILKLLAKGELYSQEVSQQLVDMLKAQQLNLKLPYFIPALEPDDPSVYNKKVSPGTVVVAHKTGEIDGAQHDVGIFYLPGDRKYVLAVLTSDLSSDKAGAYAIAKISEIIYDRMKAVYPLPT